MIDYEKNWQKTRQIANKINNRLNYLVHEMFLKDAISIEEARQWFFETNANIKEINEIYLKED